MDFLTIKQASERLGITVGRVHQLINDGRLPAQKLGSQYVIREGDLERVADRKTGRPPGSNSSVKDAEKPRRKSSKRSKKS